jgi:hypothetical protein
VNKSGQGVINAKAHLTCYALSHFSGPTQSRRVSISNQFGTAQVMTVVVDPPQTLCLPSSKAPAGVAPRGSPDSRAESLA